MSFLRERRSRRGEREKSHGGRGRSKRPASSAQRGRSWFCQTKIHQLGAGFGQHDVAGLQVAMHDAGAVRLVKCAGDRKLWRKSHTPHKIFEALFGAEGIIDGINLQVDQISRVLLISLF